MEDDEVVPDVELRLKPAEASTPVGERTPVDLADFHGPQAVEVKDVSPPKVVAPAERPAPPARAVAELTELPLFLKGLPESTSEGTAELGFWAKPEEPPAEPLEPEEPLVKVPRTPRAPLAVRRNTPAPGRVREKYQPAADTNRQIGLLERDLLDLPDEDQAPVDLQSAPLHRDPPAEHSVPEIPEQAAGAVRRLEAAVVDLLFLGSINLVIVWLTLQRCELTLSQIGDLPVLPLAAMLCLLDGLYLLMFTAASGQTVGKMTAGIRVVGTSGEAITNDRVTLKQAVLRSVLTFPSVLALGVGFAPALLGRGLALHDRFAHTRVVRA